MKYWYGKICPNYSEIQPNQDCMKNKSQIYKERIARFWSGISASRSSHMNNLLIGILADHTEIYEYTTAGVFPYDLNFRLLFP